MQSRVLAVFGHPAARWTAYQNLSRLFSAAKYEFKHLEPSIPQTVLRRRSGATTVRRWTEQLDTNGSSAHLWVLINVICWATHPVPLRDRLSAAGPTNIGMPKPDQSGCLATREQWNSKPLDQPDPQKILAYTQSIKMVQEIFWTGCHGTYDPRKGFSRRNEDA